jgi:hypothetical protein
VVVVLTRPQPDWIPLGGAVLASALGFCYFVQQQKLAETRLFLDLFTAFNARYDALNDSLTRIADKGGALDQESRQKIVDYLNLCAEEYLFHSEGYIHSEVWRSWCAGMLWHLEREPFGAVWLEESQSNSYYGFSVAEARKGARKS